MMTRADQIRYAILAWDFALTLSVSSVPPGEKPNLSTIRAVLAIGRRQPWLRLIEAALIEIGLAAVDDILKGD